MVYKHSNSSPSLPILGRSDLFTLAILICTQRYLISGFNLHFLQITILNLFMSLFVICISYLMKWLCKFFSFFTSVVFLLLKCEGLFCGPRKCQSWTSLVAQMVKNLPAMQEICIQSLGQEDPLEKGTAFHSSILAWRISWSEKPGGL